MAYLSIFDTLKYIYIFPLFAALTAFAISALKKRISSVSPPALIAQRGSCKKRLYIIVFAIVFSGQLIYWLGCYPGGFNLDAYGQWDQAHGLMPLNNWHPLFTTMIYWTITRIYDSFSFCIFIQILLFSLSVSYLYAVLLKIGASKTAVISATVYTGLNPAIGLNNVCLYKDVYFTIALIWMTVFLVRIVESGGKWLEKTFHIILLTADLSCMAFIRHNWVFCFVGLIMTAALVYRKQVKRIAIVLLTTVFFVAAVQGPVFSLLNIRKHSNTVGEIVGVPMAAMANVFVTEYENTPEDVKSFLESIADAEEWKEKYILGEWDSCKWEFGGIDLFKEQSIKTFIKLFIESVIAAPDAVYKSVRENTRVVWQVVGNAEWNTWVYIEDNDYGITPSPNRFFEKISDWLLKCSLTIFGTALCWNIGVPNLILVLIIWLAVRRKEYEKLIFSVPILTYNLLTMFLLCGPSHRYFYFNSVLILPIIILSTVRQKHETELGRYNTKREQW